MIEQIHQSTRLLPSHHLTPPQGIKGIVFDKDNTLTAPYVDTAHEAVADALERSRRVFGTERLLILSNSAGTGDDPGAVLSFVVVEGVG